MCLEGWRSTFGFPPLGCCSGGISAAKDAVTNLGGVCPFFFLLLARVSRHALVLSASVVCLSIAREGRRRDVRANKNSTRGETLRFPAHNRSPGASSPLVLRVCLFLRTRGRLPNCRVTREGHRERERERHPREEVSRMVRAYRKVRVLRSLRTLILRIFRRFPEVAAPMFASWGRGKPFF